MKDAEHDNDDSSFTDKKCINKYLINNKISFFLTHAGMPIYIYIYIYIYICTLSCEYISLYK